MRAFGHLYCKIRRETQRIADESGRVFLIYEARRYVHRGDARYLEPIIHVQTPQEGPPPVDEETSGEELLQELGPPYSAPKYLATIKPVRSSPRTRSS